MGYGSGPRAATSLMPDQTASPGPAVSGRSQQLLQGATVGVAMAVPTAAGGAL